MPSIGFDPAAHYYDSTRGFPPGVAQAIREAIVAHTGASLQTTRFLELGIGTGRIALPFIEKGYRYVGVDLSLAMMEQLVNKWAKWSATSPNYPALVQADITWLPFQDASFEVVLAVDVLHLVENWPLALKEAVRMLRQPGGWLIIGYDAPLKGEKPSVSQQVHQHWDAILAEFGLNREALLPGLSDSTANREALLENVLQRFGAQTEAVTLVQYRTPALSLRQIAERHSKRMYSADWSLPQVVHTAAVARLEEWLKNEGPQSCPFFS